MSAILAIATAGAAGLRAAEDSPFVPGGAQVAAVRAEASLLDGLEFAGLVRTDSAVQVYLFRAASRRGQWLSLGVESEGMLADAIDDQRQAVRVRAGAHERWLTLRGAQVAAVPLVLHADRSINWDHMKLTDREKEIKAATQLWELMEISRQARAP